MELHGDGLKRARLAEGLSQSELAHKIGVSQPTISTWELGRIKPDAVQLAKLESVLGKGQSGEIAPAGASSPFGAWLRKARSERGMSVPELSAAADITAAAIYNIEAGKSLNPQAETRTRLERALKTKVPADVEQEAASEQDIVGLGPLTDFDPYDKDNLPTVSGVYVFYDVSDRPIYVGKAEIIKARVRDHEEKFWFKRPLVERALYVKIDDATLRHQVEQLLIKFLKSNAVINRQSVDR